MKEHELFELLVREHATSLRVFLRAALRDDRHTDDLFQETLVQAWRHLDRYDRARSFGKWLRGIGMNLVREHRRRLARAPRQLDDAVLEILDSHCEAFHGHRHDTLDDELSSLRNCIERLPAHFRDAVLLRYTRGLRGTDLAQSLQITVENAKKRLQRARLLLLECVRQSLGLAGGSA
ncbi:MAG: sigma-70 family RNA polymerase sigma factor [Planctomycetes bacterium]|nr:sigma-70 family RNA polymerase sigma factor [Planctomycetota bacterium]MCB9868424.1 sigma-70 family RNA polymerase sigma factor [Planctomycetota bacterium]